MSGNIRAKKRVIHAKKLLEETGVDPERLEMFHIAASQGPLFAQKATEFTEKIRLLNNEKSIQGNAESCGHAESSCQADACDAGTTMENINDNS